MPRQQFQEPTQEEWEAAQRAQGRDPAADRQRLIQTGNDGHGGKLLPGTVAPDFGGGQFGDINNTSAYDADVDRARRMGAEGQNRAAVQLDQTQANESRGLQMGALGLLQSQANGTAPSSAETLGQRANQNAVMQAGQAVTGAKGGIGGALAAQRSAGMQAAGGAMVANAANADQRAAEISRGQSQFAGGALATEKQDIGAATANAQLEAQQRALNEARQQDYERRAWNTRNIESQAEDRYKRNTDAAMNLNEKQSLDRQARDSAETQNTMNTINSGLMGATRSDPRTKKNVIYMGSLAHLGKY